MSSEGLRGVIQRTAQAQQRRHRALDDKKTEVQGQARGRASSAGQGGGAPGPAARSVDRPTASSQQLFEARPVTIMSILQRSKLRPGGQGHSAGLWRADSLAQEPEYLTTSHSRGTHAHLNPSTPPVCPGRENSSSPRLSSASVAPEVSS